ncbi:MAG: Fe-S protein assembly chaperone HscA, partial [Gammaproteobacteria bacterium]|nr:Fe-S protein assembly chaperone HscA [Gammaproteobacteria bacterium]
GAELLSEEERKKIDLALVELKEIRAGENADKIKQAIEKVESVCAEYVGRRMDSNIRKALAGHNVDEFSEK